MFKLFQGLFLLNLFFHCLLALLYMQRYKVIYTNLQSSYVLYIIFIKFNKRKKFVVCTSSLATMIIHFTSLLLQIILSWGRCQKFMGPGTLVHHWPQVRSGFDKYESTLIVLKKCLP